MSNEGANLPQDMIIEILTRLPPKSLCNFKCVSKPWLTLISDTHFINKHLHHNFHRNKLILVSPSLHSLYSIELSSASASASASPSATKLHFNKPDIWAKILGSCNGLLFVACIYNYKKFILNPTTRQSIELLDFPYPTDPRTIRVIYGFGYNSASSDYKVVAISYNHDRAGDDRHLVENFVDVYSVKSREWTRIGKSFYDHHASVPWQGVFLNGCVHWLAYKNDLLVIAVFDLADEAFHDLPAPAESKTEMVHYYDILILGEYLCVVACLGNWKTDIWMLKEYGVPDSWTKFTITGRNLYPIKPFQLLGDKEMLLKVYGEKMVKYDLEEHTVTDMVVNGIPVDTEVGATYVESLVSPHPFR